MPKNELEFMDYLLNIMQDSADIAVQLDRNQDSRIWRDLDFLMSGDHIDYSHIKVLLPKFLSNYGKFKEITAELIIEFGRYIKSLHNINLKIRTKEKYPFAPLPSIRTLKRKYTKTKQNWDQTLLLAMKIVGVDTDVKYDKHSLMQILNREVSRTGFNLQQLEDEDDE